MDGTKTLSQVADPLGVTKGQIEQWIARGQFIAPTALRGKTREWEFWDVLRLAVFVRLVTSSISMPPREAGLVTLHPLNTAEDEPSFFVAWQGKVSTQVIGGEPGERGDAYIGGAPMPKVVRASFLSDFILSPNVFWSVVLPLSRIEAALEAAWSFDQPVSIWSLLD